MTFHVLPPFHFKACFTVSGLYSVDLDYNQTFFFWVPNLESVRQAWWRVVDYFFSSCHVPTTRWPMKIWHLIWDDPSESKIVNYHKNNLYFTYKSIKIPTFHKDLRKSWMTHNTCVYTFCIIKKKQLLRVFLCLH